MGSKYIRKIIMPLIALLFCGVIVLLERNGIRIKDLTNPSKGKIEYSKSVETKTDCLILTASDSTEGDGQAEIAEYVLSSMRYGYDVKRVAKGEELEPLDKYRNVVITFEDWSVLGNHIFTLCDWVENGGHLLVSCTPEPTNEFLATAAKLGITNNDIDYIGIRGLHIKNDFMIGADESKVFPLIEDGEEAVWTSLHLILDSDCEVMVESEDGSVPIIWRRAYGKGNFVVINDVLTDKYQRGFVCCAFSLLDDVCIYPVINGSAYYLDDFPSPVPEGNAKFITRDYGVSISAFYTNIWWPEVINWEKEYGIKHTGLVIEHYSNQVEGDIEKNESVTQFISFGNMLLRNGGEIGLHGYNHQPLCLKGVDDDMQFADYELWESKEEMKAAMQELYRFCKQCFPTEEFHVYVPPSNIISEAGIRSLTEACPEVRVVASVLLYSNEENAYVQEFEVDENGVIHTPRITSGCNPDAYQLMTQLSEFNFQYVQTHFMHPDDALDEDRGAADGWEKMSHNFRAYLNWITQSTPSIRNMTGSELGTAVEVYDKLSVNRNSREEEIELELGGFGKEAYFIMRMNHGKVTDTTNCEVENLKGNLYLVHAKKQQIKIGIGETK